jgi:polysaccharide deacetylase 2 family uncharacterized protein YibQ
VSKRKKKSSTRSGTGILILVALAAVAIVGGCSLLRPAQRSQPAHPAASPAVTQITAAPVATPTASAAPATEPTTSVVAEPTEAGSGVRLALIIDDCGQWPVTERALIALPIPLTMSVLPDVRYNAAIAREAADAGKGVMLHLPMETVSGLYPGPGEVTTEMTDAQIVAQTEHDLAQVPLAQGVNNHEGSKGSADARVMGDVATTIAKHGDLFFIDSKTAANSVAQDVAAKAGLATASRDVFLDDQDNVAYVEGQLRSAAAIALKHGSAIAIGHPRAATLAAIRALYPELQREGITFVLARDLTTR